VATDSGRGRVSRWDAAFDAALDAARRAWWESGDVPVGAAVLDPDGILLAVGGNERELTGDPTAHAEIVALRRAARVWAERRAAGPHELARGAWGHPGPGGVEGRFSHGVAGAARETPATTDEPSPPSPWSLQSPAGTAAPPNPTASEPSPPSPWSLQSPAGTAAPPTPTASEPSPPSPWRLDGCTLVVTLEPCAMCAGAAVAARLARLVYGPTDPKAGAVASLFDVVRDPRLPHRLDVRSGLREADCRALLAEFFAARRLSP